MRTPPNFRKFDYFFKPALLKWREDKSEPFVIMVESRDKGRQLIGQLAPFLETNEKIYLASWIKEYARLPFPNRFKAFNLTTFIYVIIEEAKEIRNVVYDEVATYEGTDFMFQKYTKLEETKK